VLLLVVGCAFFPQVVSLGMALPIGSTAGPPPKSWDGERTKAEASPKNCLRRC
jgi:hypothetical protein